jgi:cyclophilin family peptidyl-prolyl cis-trans isomerase
MPTEACPIIRRGSVAWIGSGPEFFISLANHQEWKNAYTVFGSVLPEDMEIAERIAQLPSKPDVWNNINVSVLEKPVSLSLRRIKTSNGDLNTQM